MKAKNVKDAMSNDAYKVNKIYSKGSKQIRVDFHPRFANSKYEICSFWIDREYFRRKYPQTYDRN